MFFGFVLAPGKSYKFTEEELGKGDVLSVTNAVLSAPGKKVTQKSIQADVYVRVRDEDFIVARLSDHIPQATLDLHLSVLDEAELFVKDNSAPVHLVGFYEN
jgi:hypothetical protein